MNPISDSINHLLIITFPKTSSQFYPVAVELAKDAFKYEESTVGNKPFHVAFFY